MSLYGVVMVLVVIVEVVVVVVPAMSVVVMKIGVFICVSSHVRAQQYQKCVSIVHNRYCHPLIHTQPRVQNIDVDAVAWPTDYHCFHRDVWPGEPIPQLLCRPRDTEVLRVSRFVDASKHGGGGVCQRTSCGSGNAGQLDARVRSVHWRKRQHGAGVYQWERVGGRTSCSVSGLDWYHGNTAGYGIVRQHLLLPDGPPDVLCRRNR